MASVSGTILFDRSRTAAPPASMTGMADVPVMLQNIATNVRLIIRTNTGGNFSFINVPDGNYRVVEAYRAESAPLTPGDFNTAAIGPVLSAVVPPITYALNPPAGATDLDCTTPNTLLITVSGANITNLYICNGPVKYIPIQSITDACAVISPHNLITDMEYGTMGYFPAGKPANTGVPYEPFPDNVPDFDYVLPNPAAHAPEDGQYTVQNIMNDDNSIRIGAWWRIADHTTGNETGRMMIVNGYTPGAVFFTSDVDVTPNTHYLFSAWILNLFRAQGWANPALGVQILDENGQIIFHQTLGTQIPVNTAMPEWKQIGTIIQSYNNTRLTVKFLSEGPAAIGNDYAIDDVALQEVSIPVFKPVKECDFESIEVGQLATYAVTLRNTCFNPLTNVTFQDVIPPELLFMENTVSINGINTPGLNPNTGFVVPNIPGGSAVVIKFKVMAVTVPETNPVQNMASMSYQYTPVTGGIPGGFNVESNLAPIRIYPPWCRIAPLVLQRARDVQEPVSPGGIVTFERRLVSIGDVYYQPDGSITIVRRGTYIVAWFAAGMHGFATNGQFFQLKKQRPGTSQWEVVAGTSNHSKVSITSGYAVINVTEEEVAEYNGVTLALFNAADAEIKLSLFNSNASILIFGADFKCIDTRLKTIGYELADIDNHMQELHDALYLSDIVEIWSQTPELLGLGTAVIRIGFNYNFWGIGALDAPQVLDAGTVYYLAKSSQYTPLTYYQGDSTFGTLWIETPNGSATKYPIRFNSTGIYIVPDSQLALPAGTRFLFTRLLILVEPGT